jgi:hypothetical protein
LPCLSIYIPDILKPQAKLIWENSKRYSCSIEGLLLMANGMAGILIRRAITINKFLIKCITSS